MTIMEKKNQVYMQLHYTVKKNEMRLFREDSFFFPAFSEEEHNAVINHIANILHNNNDAYVYIQKWERNGNTFPCSEFDRTNLKMYDRNGNGKNIVTVKTWDETNQSYNPYGETMTIKNFIEDLQNEINYHTNN